MGKKIVCTSCGAEFDEELAGCPYCGSANLKGEETEYMKRLEGVREDMEGLSEDSMDELKAEVKKQGRRLGRLFLVMGIVVLVFVGIFLLGRRPDKTDYRDVYAWKQEYFPKLDALYEDGRTDELLLLYDEILTQENSAIYDWSHINFLSALIACRSVDEYLALEASDGLNDFFMTDLFQQQWRLKGIFLRKSEFTEREFELLLPYLERSEDDFAVRWQMSAEDYERFEKALKDNYAQSVPWNMSSDYVKKYLKEGR